MSNLEEVKKIKRNIIRFNNTSINLEHVTTICCEEKKITFGFYYHSCFVEADDEEAAQKIFEQIMNLWSN